MCVRCEHCDEPAITFGKRGVLCATHYIEKLEAELERAKKNSEEYQEKVVDLEFDLDNANKENDELACELVEFNEHVENLLGGARDALRRHLALDWRAHRGRAHRGQHGAGSLGRMEGQPEEAIMPTINYPEGYEAVAAVARVMGRLEEIIGEVRSMNGSVRLLERLEGLLKTLEDAVERTGMCQGAQVADWYNPEVLDELAAEIRSQEADCTHEAAAIRETNDAMRAARV